MIVKEQQNGDVVWVDQNRSIPGVAGRTELLRLKSSEIAGQTPSVEMAGLAPDSVTTTDVVAESVVTEDLEASGTVTLPNDSITAAMLKASVSAEATATGSAQNVAHGLGATPSMVLVTVTSTDGNATVVAEGTHTSTNVVLTVTPAGAKFKVLAIA